MKEDIRCKRAKEEGVIGIGLVVLGEDGEVLRVVFDDGRCLYCGDSLEDNYGGYMMGDFDDRCGKMCKKCNEKWHKVAEDFRKIKEENKLGADA